MDFLKNILHLVVFAPLVCVCLKVVMLPVKVPLSVTLTGVSTHIHSGCSQTWDCCRSGPG